MSDFDKKPLTAEELMPLLNRPMPVSDEAEKGTLSCLLQDPENRIGEARRVLPLEAFYHFANRTIYEALLTLDSQMPRKAIDAVTLTHYLRDKELLDGVGGAAAISELFAFVPIPTHFPFYVRILRDKHVQRTLVATGAEIAFAAYEWGKEEESADGIIDLVTQAEAKTFAVLESARDQTENNNSTKKADECAREWLEHNERVIANEGKVLGQETGILEFDSTFHGIDDIEGEMIVIAGRPGQGKTAMGVTIANHLSVVNGIPGLIFSIEMSCIQLNHRLILGMAGVDVSKALTGHYSKEDHQAMKVQYAKVTAAPLFINDNAAINEMELLAQIQYHVRKNGIRWIMVDHLHKVRHSNPKIHADERMRLVNVMEVLRFAKKQFKLATYVLVQMSRETDRNKGQAPTLADLSGSGAIEQDTEKVGALYRPSYYYPWHKLKAEHQQSWRALVQARRERNRYQWSDGRKYSEEDGGWARQDYEEDCCVFVLKNRSGPTPEMHIRYESEFTRFSSRMPKLKSDNPLDWMIGTYRIEAAKAKADESEAKKAGAGFKKNWKQRDQNNGGDAWHADFTRDDDDQPGLSDSLRGGVHG